MYLLGPQTLGIKPPFLDRRRIVWRLVFLTLRQKERFLPEVYLQRLVALQVVRPFPRQGEERTRFL